MTRLLQFSAFVLALIVSAFDPPVSQAAASVDPSAQSLKADDSEDTTETDESSDPTDAEDGDYEGDTSDDTATE